MDTTTPVGSMSGPSLTWHGPVLPGGEESYVEITILETFEGGLTPTDGGAYFDVPGPELAYGGIDAVSYTGEPLGRRAVWMHLLAGGRQIVIGAALPEGTEGDEMARRLIASIAVA
ncbi:hypothetical protein [Blastococcus atacamensis]|uniref:hypothetical protein n=1 Tax=Blastococcus atacamensis TaxID=2070508 RepID=UPI00130010DF|nr:hypothetical protein [Blastococcus atacamensis]